MSENSLVVYTCLTNHMSRGRQGRKIDKIFIHHMAGDLTLETCGNVFLRNEASAHYGIDSWGKVGQYVREENTAWHCGNWAYNLRSIGIELADCGGAPDWEVSELAIESCIRLIADICRRNGIPKINYTGDLSGNLCMHCWTMSTVCPGPFLKTKFQYIADRVNHILASEPRRYKAVKDMPVRLLSYSSAPKVTTVPKGSVHTALKTKTKGDAVWIKVKHKGISGWTCASYKGDVYWKLKL